MGKLSHTAASSTIPKRERETKRPQSLKRNTKKKRKGKEHLDFLLLDIIEKFKKAKVWKGPHKRNQENHAL